jgi:hypothetical protein
MKRAWLLELTATLAAGFLVAQPAVPGHVTGAVDVKVTLDNPGLPDPLPDPLPEPTPGFDAQNKESPETSLAISPVNPAIVAAVAIDGRMFVPPAMVALWAGLYVSTDGGATWFNTFVPGFRTDASPAGLASPLRGFASATDPVVKFDAEGHLYVAGIAANFPGFPVDEGARPDNVAYVARYDYTPGTPAGVNTPTSAGNPPHFTYAFTTIVDKGSVRIHPPQGAPHPSSSSISVGNFVDKPWLWADTHPASPCRGTLYHASTRKTGFDDEPGASIIVFSRSTDGGRTFSQPHPLSQKGHDGFSQGANIGTGPDGRVYVSWRSNLTPLGSEVRQIRVARSDDCGQRFGKPVTAALFNRMRNSNVATGLIAASPTLSWIAVDDSDADVVYVAHQGLAGPLGFPSVPFDADVFVARSVDGGQTWDAPVRVNDDATGRHQFFPTVAVSGGILHVAWYDLRQSLGNSVADARADVFYASSVPGANPLRFSHNVRVTDLSFQPNCNIVPGFAFIGDYIELAARVEGATHVVHVAWADNRDMNPCLLPGDSVPDPLPPQIFNQNVYTDRLEVVVP